MDYEYIVDEKGRYYVPRPPGICAGIKRNTEFQERLGVEPMIVSPKVWGWVKTKHEIQILKV